MQFIRDRIEEYLRSRYKGAKIYSTLTIDKEKVGSVCRDIPGVGKVWYRTYRDPMTHGDFVAYELPTVRGDKTH
jgi:hypothetical protein